MRPAPTGDYLFARAFAELAATGDARGGRGARGRDALPRARRGAAAACRPHDPATTVERTSSAARSRPGSCSRPRAGSAAARGEYGLALGIAFQIADDVLDCAGATIETGKIAGTDLRDGTPTLPLLLAAQRGRRVRSALAGGPIDGALLRVAATGALERSREVALDYARQRQGVPQRRARTATSSRP